MRSSGPADYALVLLGIATIIAAWRTVKATADNAAAAKANAEAVVLAERAYVDISQGSSMTFVDNSPTVSHFVVKNYGATPADVVAFSMCFRHQAANTLLPDDPPYQEPQRLGAFVMPDGAISVNGGLPPIPPAVVQAIQEGTQTAWLIGYVDYRDRFGQRHRGGYARRYIQSNGVLAFEDQRGYNYDRKREKDEIHDWEPRDD